MYAFDSCIVVLLNVGVGRFGLMTLRGDTSEI